MFVQGSGNSFRKSPLGLFGNVSKVGGVEGRCQSVKYLGSLDGDSFRNEGRKSSLFVSLAQCHKSGFMMGTLASLCTGGLTSRLHNFMIFVFL